MSKFNVLIATTDTDWVYNFVLSKKIALKTINIKQPIMTTLQVANRYYKLAKQQKWMEILNELYGQDIVNKEPEHAAAMGIPTITKGMDAVMAKGEARRKMIEEIHDQECSEPVTGGKFFSVSMMRDVTFKGKPRVKLEEIALFEVNEGKIISEQFFY